MPNLQVAGPTGTLEELCDSGILFLVNSLIFQPRGYSLAIDPEGWWCLLGDGSDPVPAPSATFSAALLENLVWRLTRGEDEGWRLTA